MTTRGIRNNNPGNIVKSDIPWLGKVVGADPTFESFDTAEHGLRALCENLLAYEREHGLNTLAKIVPRWSATDQAAYLADLVKWTGFAADTPLPLHEPAVLAKIAAGIVLQENGEQPYSVTLLLDAANAALGHPLSPVGAASPGAPMSLTLPGATRTETLTDITPNEFAAAVKEFEAAGATVHAETQPNGLYMLVATFAGSA